MKQTCDVCGKTRKGKHFPSAHSNDVLWCDKCRDKCYQPHLLPPVNGQRTVGRGPGAMTMITTSRLPFYMMDRAEWAEHGFHSGVITNGDPLNPPQAQAPSKPKAPPKHLTKTQGVTFDSPVERLKLQLKAGLNQEGKPLTDKERSIIQGQIDLFETEPDEDEEAAAIASILGNGNAQAHKESR